ncbi:glycosyltransferase [Salinicoccus bachuensis]|uniref:Glycosyltransferase n=1 Tax=Salinicoccus bachuensis TaxID=3136731 RepID=A0ABZ3CKX7_9STAP
MKPRILFLLNSVDVNRGGLTHASLRQASTFADAGYDTELLTFRYDPRFPLICRKLVHMGKVSKNVRIRNLFHERALYDRTDRIQRKRVKVDISEYEGAYKVSKRPKHNAYRLYQDGRYVKYISLREDDTLDFIDYYGEYERRERREFFDYYGQMTRLQRFSPEENKLEEEHFYNRNGDTILTMRHDPETNKIIHVKNFGEGDRTLSETDGDQTPYRKDWLDQVLGESDRDTVVISDTRPTDELVVLLDDSRVKGVIRPHSNHLRNPDDPSSELNRRNKYAIESVKDIDALVVLTEKQRQDIISRFGHPEKVFVVPNYYDPGPPKVTGLRSFLMNVRQRSRKIERDMKKVVIVSRFSSIKSIDHTIRAFKDVVEAVPEAKLEIWGKGDKKQEYKDLIKKLDLDGNVKVKGYTQHPENVYRSGAMSVVTSKAEGFSLSVMESMVNETPVVSYDIRYGPSDMIEDGENGFLIKKGDTGMLAERMIHMLQNPEETRAMGVAAGKTMRTKFGIDSYQKKWFSLVNHLLENDESRGAQE